MDKKDIEWMRCTQCKQTVIRNDVSICLFCQGAYTAEEQTDSWDNIDGKPIEKKSVEPQTREHKRELLGERNNTVL